MPVRFEMAGILMVNIINVWGEIHYVSNSQFYLLADLFVGKVTLKDYNSRDLNTGRIRYLFILICPRGVDLRSLGTQASVLPIEPPLLVPD